MIAKRILNIMPANGWKARFFLRNLETTEPLVCWGLVEGEDGETKICGFVAASAGSIREPCEAMSHFRGYVHGNEPVTPPRVVNGWIGSRTGSLGSG